MGGVTTGQYLFIKTTIPILVALDNSARLWTVGANAGEGAIIYVGSFTALYLQNTNPTTDATVDIAIAGS
jgi:hypothetical protein